MCTVAVRSSQHFAACRRAGYRLAMTDDEMGPAWPEHAALFLDLDGTLLVQFTRRGCTRRARSQVV